MNKQYCPECGGYHEVTTAGCPNKRTTLFPDNIAQPRRETVEDKLDKIIKLLEEIEYFVRTK